MKMNFKTFLSLFLIVIIQACFCKPPMNIPPKNPNDPPVLPSGVTKKVLIIGGGLAGLSAALELAERGYQVTIKEKSYENVGGKLRCVPVEVFPNQTFYIEHGFHAWFNNYFQFHDIRTRLDINDNFRKWPKVHYVFREYKPEVIYSVGPYPLNLLGIIARSPNIKLTDALKSTLGMPDLMFYDFNHINEKYDNITFGEWAAEKKVAKDFYEIVLEPALSVTLNERKIFSAAEMLAFMQIYFLSNSESDEREVAKVNYEESVLKPWKNYLKKLNVNIMLNSTVNSLKVDPKTNNVFGTVDQDFDDKNIYDSIIMTADVGAAQGILNNTYANYKQYASIAKALVKCNNNSVSQMLVAPDYRVLRVFFDKQMNSSTPDILETPDFSPINLVAQYHLLEQEFIDWAAKTGGSVIEFHCYTWSNFFDPNTDDSKVWELISPTAKLIYPEIFDRNFKVLAYHVNKYQNFASFQKGLMPMRPKTDTCSQANLNNFYLAGDWIKTDYPSALMERAVSTGREAANQVLLKDHVRQAPLTVVNLKGPGI